MRRTDDGRLWLALDRLGQYEAGLQEGAVKASESSGFFGLHWRPGFEMLKVPDVPGVCVLFFKDENMKLRQSDNLFRLLQQDYRSPSRYILSFSWIRVDSPRERGSLFIKMQQMDFDELWEMSVDTFSPLTKAYEASLEVTEEKKAA